MPAVVVGGVKVSVPEVPDVTQATVPVNTAVPPVVVVALATLDQV